MTFAALVTGGNKGIGFELVKRLAQYILEHKNGDGVVYLGSRDATRGEAAATELNQTLGTSIVKPLVLDVDSRESVVNAAEEVKKDHSGLNVLACNAGWAPKAAECPEADPSIMVKTFKTNYYGVRHCIDAFLSTMRQGGRVVVTSSCAGEMAWKGASPENQDLIRSIKNLSELDELAEELTKYAQNKTFKAHGWPVTAYGLSKLLVTKVCEIYGQYALDNVLVVSVHPGWCKSDMAGWERPPLTAGEGADRLFQCCTLPSTAEIRQGAYFSDFKDATYI